MCKRSDRIVTDVASGEVVCSNCGMVISDKIQDINHSERRTFSSEEVMSNKGSRRTGSPTSLAKHDMGLSTIIGRINKDAAGNKLDAITSSSMSRLRTWDIRTQYSTSNKKNLVLAFNELDILKDKLGLSDAAVEKTAYIYRKAQARGLVRGKLITAFVTAAIYASCREMEIPWTLKDLTAASNLKRKDIARNYRMIISELCIKIPNADPMKCIAKVANKANLTENTTRQAISIMKEVIEKQISAGKKPMGLAATVLYLSCLKTGEDTTQIQMADAAGVTEVTVRNLLRELKNKLKP
ncbi:MAG: transcription initiation factor IIB [Nitrososphaeraceae archaeon]|nr:transcription initiation factor IIB [Nitrososphaeraceae archaeon]